MKTPTHSTLRAPLLAALLASTAFLPVSAIADGLPARAVIVAQAGLVPPIQPQTTVADPKQAKDKAAADKAAADKAAADKAKAGQGKPTPPAAVQVTPPNVPAAAEIKPPDVPNAPAAAQTAPKPDNTQRPTRDTSHDHQTPPAPAAAAPAAAAKPADKPPAAMTQAPQAPAAQPNQASSPPPAAAQGTAKTGNPPAATAAAPMAPPTQARDAGEFMRRDGQQQSRGMDDIRKQRRETKDGNRVVIQEGDRTIERDGNRTIIRHNEADRFSVGARDVKVEHRGNETISIIVRPNGVSIVSTTDGNGHLLRRVRRDRNGHELVIIDNGFSGAPRGDYFVDLPPPRSIPRDRYIVDAGHADRDELYAIFTAQPVERIERRYTLDQIRYSDPLRARMPRVDLDVNFDTGSWQLTPDQVGSLSTIAQGLNRAIDKNPREVFLIEGHTDAVGSDEDNLSLSDRRAEAVAVALTEQFQVPPENLVTQGYGEQYLKVPTEEAERTNRRVAVRRITPLIDQAQTTGGNR